MQEQLTAISISCIISFMTVEGRPTNPAGEHAQGTTHRRRDILLRPIAKVVESWFAQIEALENMQPPAAASKPKVAEPLDKPPQRRG
jgi:hypothetical protein